VCSISLHEIYIKNREGKTLYLTVSMLGIYNIDDRQMKYRALAE
jgi:hypothetical protein